MVDTKAVSVRLPLELLNELNTYATDKGMVRGGDANIGGAIIAILREHFGEHGNVKQVSDNVDIEAMINEAISKQLDDRDRVINVAIASLRESIEALKTNEATAPANFTSALLQRVKDVAPLKLKEVA